MPQDAAPGAGPPDHDRPVGRHPRWVWAVVLLVLAPLIVGIGAWVRSPRPAVDAVIGQTTSSSASASAAASGLVPVTTSRPATLSHGLSTPPRTPPSPSAVRSTGPAATDVLVPGNGHQENVVQHQQVTVVIQMMNSGDQTLTLTGPIRLLGPDRQPVSHGSAHLIEGWVWDSEAAESAPALRSIAPHEHIALVVEAVVDCRSPDGPENWPAGYPEIVIPLAHFAEPWMQLMGDIVSPSEDLPFDTVCDS